MKYIMPLFILLMTPTPSAPAADRSHEEMTSLLDRRIPALMERYDIPGVVVALIGEGKTVWTAAYGQANPAKGAPMTVDTHCRVESISKSVTAWGVMRLVEQGRIDLDAPVTNYIKSWKFPPSPFPVEKVSTRLLLSQSAGMPLGTIGVRYSPTVKRPSLRESLYMDAVLMREPGHSFSYSNAGFNLLELLVEEVTGRDFAEHMRTEVLLPLGMRNSSYEWSADMHPPVPPGHDTNGKPVPVYVYPEKAAGGLFSTVGDIAAFVCAGMTRFSHVRHGVLSAGSIAALYTPRVEIPGLYGLAFDAYGFGHFIERFPDGTFAVSHGGQGTGWMTHFHSIPGTGDGIVILTNSQRSWPLFAEILGDWAAWCGLPGVGMGLIVKGQKILWALIAFVALALFAQTARLARGLATGKRAFRPLAGESAMVRSVQFGLSVVLSSGLLWAMSLDYLFLTSVFPIAAVWLGYATVFAAAVLAASAVLPETDRPALPS
ncbi:MAG TPA: serine hydrolase domain-containing protein [Spirochaetota bacterium]|nr:serine hydrolase domain-containing protein [Spirochaetota bacterium]